MSVLDDEEHRPLLADTREELGHGRVQAVALGVGVCLDRWRELAGPRSEVREQPRELTAAGAERGAQLVRLDGAREAVERLDERAVGSVHHLVAGAVQDERAGARRLGRELADEPALARSGLAADEHDAASRPGRRRRERAEQLQLAGASDERRSRRETERPGQVAHSQDDSQI